MIAELFIDVACTHVRSSQSSDFCVSHCFLLFQNDVLALRPFQTRCVVVVVILLFLNLYPFMSSFCGHQCRRTHLRMCIHIHYCIKVSMPLHMHVFMGVIPSSFTFILSSTSSLRLIAIYSFSTSEHVAWLTQKGRFVEAIGVCSRWQRDLVAVEVADVHAGAMWQEVSC